MSMSAINSQNYYSNSMYNQQNNFQQIKTDFAQLGQALQSGNLAQAQADYSNLQNLQQSTQAAQHMKGHGEGIEALLQQLNADSTQNNTATTTAAQNTLASQNNSLQQPSSASSIENLIAQYMQTMLSGMGTQANQFGASSLGSLGLSM